MEIKTKYNLGDFVYPIHRKREKQFVKCQLCNGSGEITIKETNKTIECPECNGEGGFIEWQLARWYVSTEEASKIGRISIELYSKKYNKRYENRILYMLENTGVGSGTLWKEEDLFLTLKEALDECDKRNKNL